LKTHLLVAAALVASAGCSSPTLREGFPRGFDQEIEAGVELKSPPQDATTLLTTVDTELTKRLGDDKDKLLDATIADYEKLRGEKGTIIARPDNASIEIEDFNTPGARNTRPTFEGEVTKFLFVIRDVKTRIETNPTRIQVRLVNREYSWAPQDTRDFSRLFRAEVRNYIMKTMFDVAKGMDTAPVMPRIEAVQ
jgi:hypothetical protein